MLTCCCCIGPQSCSPSIGLRSASSEAPAGRVQSASQMWMPATCSFCCTLLPQMWYRPALVQTELSLIQTDARIHFNLQAVIDLCVEHGIQLMSHSPLKGMLRSPDAATLSAKLGISVPLMALRYGLQRGFVEIFGSKSAEHIRSNLDVLTIELNTSTLATIACGTQLNRGRHLAASSKTSSCAELVSGVGSQLPDEAWLRHFIPARAKHWESYNAKTAPFGASPWDASVRLGSEEEDPITLGLRGSPASRAELRAAPALSILGPGHERALGSIRERQAVTGEPCASPQRNCSFRLHIAPASADEAHFDAGYWTLVDSLRKGVAWAIDNQKGTTRQSERKDGLDGVHHVLSILSPSKQPFWRDLEQLRRAYIEPYVLRSAFRTATTSLQSKVVVSRNVHDYHERVRKRAMLWHVDGASDSVVKVILYLTNVDHETAATHSRLGWI